MVKPVGGRGCKGVGSTHIRVPLPIADKVRRIVADFYEDDSSKPVNQFIELSESIDAARQILALKKSARVSIVRLLEKIYGQSIEL